MSSAARKRWVARQRAKGGCLSCASPAAPGRARCLRCLDKARVHALRRAREDRAAETSQEREDRLAYERQRQRLTRQAKRERGECYKCSAPALEGFTTCAWHRRRKSLRPDGTALE